MKDHLTALVATARSQLAGRNVAREYLQARILASLQRSGAMVPLAFQGGTALRFLYRLPRYSEGLDFALEGSREDYLFRGWLEKVRVRLQGEDCAVELKVSDPATVDAAFVRFPGLLYELDLSGHREEVLAVKIEVDTRPPAGARLGTTVVRRHVTLQLHHHDRASLLAGKLHAILQRPYTKGRDLYDLLWYLSDRGWPEPNLELLQNALDQTGWSGARISAHNWRSVVAGRLSALDWERIREDVAPFLEDRSELDLLMEANLLSLLK